MPLWIPEKETREANIEEVVDGVVPMCSLQDEKDSLVSKRIKRLPLCDVMLCTYYDKEEEMRAQLVKAAAKVQQCMAAPPTSCSTRRNT